MQPEKGQISIHTENIFPIIKKFLYSDHEIFLRELVSNAVDATQKLKRLASVGQFKGEYGDVTIQVKLDKDAKTITVSDNGIGMTADEMKKYINQVAFSGAAEFVEQFKDAKDANEIIGKFGLGFYSAFMVADKVEIDSLSYQEGAEPALWSSTGDTTFTIDPGNRKERGTDIILHISDDAKEFLDENRIANILDKYAKFLPVPIQFGTRTESLPDGEDEDGKPKYKSEEVLNIINTTTPIWTKKPNDLTDEEYLSFYRQLYPFAEDPLFWIHLNVDYPFNLTGVLYFPKIKNEIEIQKNRIQLYSRQVFITDEVREIIPEFLMLLQGVIDCPDIPLNVSRSFLQSDANVKKISNYISKKVADKLHDLYKEDRKAFEEKWEHIGLFVKYGMITDDKFYDRSKDYALLENVNSQFFTLDEYKDKITTLQKDKNDKINYLYATNPGAQHTYISAAEDKGYDVLKMDGPLDNHFISHLEQKLEHTSFKRIDADTIDKLVEKEETYELVLNEEQSKKVKESFEDAIKDTKMNVVVEGLSPDAMPVTITMDEWMRRMKEMSKLGGGGMMGFYGNMPESYKVSINGNHSVIKKLVEATDVEQQKIAKQLYDLAMLSHNMLTGKDLSEFVKRNVDMMA